ncbi:hypothetical protein MTO96_051671 [Rhipicephalus appendiculatus]
MRERPGLARRLVDAGNPAPQTVPVQPAAGAGYGTYGYPTTQTLPVPPPGGVTYGSYAPQTVPVMTPGAVASAATSSMPAAGMHQYGNSPFQGTSTTPVVTVLPAPVSPGHTVIVSQPGKGPHPGFPPYNSSLWINHACKYYGLICMPLESCSRKLRLPLTGCGDNTVCCNIKKTKDCSKVGGQCRWRCKKREIPLPLRQMHGKTWKVLHIRAKEEGLTFLARAMISW